MVEEKTLRDEFAMAALLGVCKYQSNSERAKKAYEIADAMMKEREKRDDDR